MKYLMRALLIVITFATMPAAYAATSPLAVTVIPPAQFPPDDFNVAGLRLGILGHQRNMYGFDFAALGNITDQDFVGLALSGVFNMTRGITTAVGIQGAGVGNFNTGKTRVVGLQIAGLVNMNSGESSVVGVQAALISNLAAHTKIYGLQVGLVNKAHTVYGFQIGLYNYAESLHGIQIGLLNVHRQGVFGISPLLNIGF